MQDSTPAFSYPPELLEALKAASAGAPDGPWRGSDRPGDRPVVCDAEGYVLAKLSDDQEGEDIGAFIQQAANFTRAYLAHLAAHGNTP